LTDLRYGAPGATVAGWWGVDVVIGPDGQPIDAARIAIPRTISGNAVAVVFRAAFGDMAALYEATGATPTAIAAGPAVRACVAVS